MAEPRPDEGDTGEKRAQCRACPWRDMAMMQENFPDVVAHADTDPDGFVCHTRCGPCVGPRLALVSASGRSDDRD